VKDYADVIIPAIRSIDPHTIILVGSPNWSQDFHLAVADPVNDPYNVMYTVHFYAGELSHQFLFERIEENSALMPLFASEWGSSSADGHGDLSFNESQQFLDMCKRLNISWAQWSFSDKDVKSAALAPGACSNHNWVSTSKSGTFIRSYLQAHIQPGSITLRTLQAAMPQVCQDVVATPFPDNLPFLWDNLFGFLQRQKVAPVVLGEWGGIYIDSLLDGKVADDEALVLEPVWSEALRDYLVEKQIGSFYWCVNPESIDTAGLLLDDYSTLNSAKMALLRRLPSTPLIPILSPMAEGLSLKQCLDIARIQALYRLDNIDSYAAEATVHNSDDESASEPTAVVIARDEASVKDAVKCAAAHEVAVCIRSGGRSYTGDSSCGGVLIDVRNLHKIVADTVDTYWVGAGNTHGELTTKLLQHGRILPTSSHGQGDGVGWALGCGHGHLSRHFGLGCDLIVGARVVDATGQLIVATDANEHSDLLWALRGAGGGQFGVVTSLLLRTVPKPSSTPFSAFVLQWPRGHANATVAFWQSWAIGHPDSTFSAKLVLPNPQKATVIIEGVLSGDLAVLNDTVDLAIVALGRPVHDDRTQFDYSQYMVHLHGIRDLRQLRDPQAGRDGKRGAFHHKSHLMKQTLGEDGIVELVRLADEGVPGAGVDGNYIELTPLGGNIAAPVRPSAFGHRDALAVVQYVGRWPHESCKTAMVRHPHPSGPWTVDH
jgi:hypothetical protein